MIRESARTEEQDAGGPDEAGGPWAGVESPAHLAAIVEHFKGEAKCAAYEAALEIVAHMHLSHERAAVAFIAGEIYKRAELAIDAQAASLERRLTGNLQH